MQVPKSKISSIKIERTYWIWISVVVKFFTFLSKISFFFFSGSYPKQQYTNVGTGQQGSSIGGGGWNYNPGNKGVGTGTGVNNKNA